MVLTDFAEKAYETAYNIELAKGVGGSPSVFAPSLVLEQITGFDAAADPGSDHPLWRVLRVPRPPGLVLVPPLWSGPRRAVVGASELPSLPVSLILQFKRPEYLKATQAKQWHMWQAPYYRFRRDRAQHVVLKRLETRVSSQAVIRYAAPAFHSIGDLEGAQLSASVINRSSHVSPATLGTHAVWTYNTAGTVGRGNPSGRYVDLESFSRFIMPYLVTETATSQFEVVRYSGLREHLASLGAACRERQPQLRRMLDQWTSALVQRDIPSDRLQPLVDYASILSLLTAQNASWWIFDGSAQSLRDE